LYQPKKTQIGNLDNQPLVIRVVNANDENDWLDTTKTAR
jgi:hypothetical protein